MKTTTYISITNPLIVMKKWILMLPFLIMPFIISAQNPVVTANNIESNSGSTVFVPITVSSFNNVDLFTLRIKYDMSAMTFTGLTDLADMTIFENSLELMV